MGFASRRDRNLRELLVSSFLLPNLFSEVMDACLFLPLSLDMT